MSRSAAAPERPGQRIVAILLMCSAVACFAGLDATAKWLGQSLDPVLLTFARYAVNVVLVAAALNGWTVPHILRSNRIGLQAIRSVALFGCTFLNFIALQYLQLTQAIAIQFTMPLFVALLAGPLLGEWAGARRLAAVAVGFAGVVVITRPGLDMHPAAILSLLNSVLYAVYAIATRMLAAHDRAATTIFYSGLAGALLLAPAAPFVWTTPASPLQWLLLGAMGFLGALGHGLLTLAHARAPAPVLSPFVVDEPQ